MHKMTVNPVVCAAAAALALGAHSAFADGATNEISKTESSIGLPSVEAAAFYRSRKIERGMVENPESVFGYEAEIGWHGLFVGVEGCYDMTNVDGRRGRYNEIETEAGYGLKLGDFAAKAAYVYKACGGDEPDTQEVEFEFEYETPCVTPVLGLNCDIDKWSGALYGVFGLKREWELVEGIGLSTHAGIGVGNSRRNSADFESDRFAFRDMNVGAELEIELCPHVKLAPFIDLYDQFTSDGRHAYRKGFVVAAGVSLAVEF